MNIRNVTEFAAFISQHNLVQGDSTLQQVINCINTYKAACSCWKAEDKQKIYDSCNRVYFHAVKHIVTNLKASFFAVVPERQITFYNDNNQVIAIISR